MVNIEHIRVFISAAELGSFSAAARQLGKGITTVAVTIGKLEDHFGTELFDRSSSRAILTAQGKRMYDMACQLNWQVCRLEDSVTRMDKGIEKSLSIGLDGLIPLDIVNLFLSKVIIEFPTLELSILRDTASELLKLLEQGEISAAIIAADAFTRSGSEFFHIANMKYTTVCSPDSALLEKNVITLEDVTAVRQIMTRDQMSNVAIASQQSISRDIWKVERTDEQIRLVEQDLGWAMLPEIGARPYIESGSLSVFKNNVECVPSVIPIELRVLPNFKRGPVLTTLITTLSTGSTL